MRTIAIDDPNICQSVTRTGCAKMAERIDVLFGVETPGDPRNTVLDGGHHPSLRVRGCSMRPLPNYFGHVLFFIAQRYKITYF